MFDSSDGTVKGKPLNSNAAQFFMPSSIAVDPGNGDVYVADGENRNGNRRIAVMDRAGKFLRQWQPEGMETVHCLATGQRRVGLRLQPRGTTEFRCTTRPGASSRASTCHGRPTRRPPRGSVARAAARRWRSGFLRTRASGSCTSSTRTARTSRSSNGRPEKSCQLRRRRRPLPRPVRPAARHRRGLSRQRLCRRKPRQETPEIPGQPAVPALKTRLRRRFNRTKACRAATSRPSVVTREPLAISHWPFVISHPMPDGSVNAYIGSLCHRLPRGVRRPA